ncbi:type II secretion system protein [Clostridium sp.]|uniref:type II secretion system protein n=1 Tax=Clostridium sp. TaxID=1506 RepID=UPI00258EE7CF|nr:type II secretion system protein [Clostridium sp.]MDF2504038.1 prepilin-type N-terminal cleavage/methylation protein [Clostridium sp.]
MKKGFTLIELVVAMAITSMIISFQCVIFVKYLKAYSKDTKLITNKAYCNQSIIIIESLIYDGMKEVNVENNDIKIISGNNENKKIRFVKNTKKIVVDYYDVYGSIKASNVVGTNISNMKAMKKDNVLYLSIMNKEGETISRCFGVKKEY